MPTAPPTYGYSGKPLFQKLGLKPGLTCLALNPPAQYAALVAGAEGVSFLTADSAAQADVVHLFCRDRAALVLGIGAALGRVAPKGMLWMSWPKKASGMFVDLTEDDLRTVILPIGWVDVKVCAVDADWSGLKFLRRRV